jgi:hypothetical protein
MRPVLSDDSITVMQDLILDLYAASGPCREVNILRVLLTWQERDQALNEAERRAMEANKIGDDMLPAAYHDQLAYYADQMAYYAAQIDIYKASIKLAQDTVSSIAGTDYVLEREVIDGKPTTFWNVNEPAKIQIGSGMSMVIENNRIARFEQDATGTKYILENAK